MVHDDKRDKGLEYLDNTPVAVPVKFRGGNYAGPDKMRQMMRELIVDMRGRSEVESFEESLDFEVDDDDDPLSSRVSQSEMRYMQEEKLLTEAEEASKVVVQRRDAANYRRKRDENRNGPEGVRDGDARSRDAGYERGSERKQEGRSGEAASGGARASEGSGESAREVAAKRDAGRS